MTEWVSTYAWSTTAVQQFDAVGRWEFADRCLTDASLDHVTFEPFAVDSLDPDRDPLAGSDFVLAEGHYVRSFPCLGRGVPVVRPHLLTLRFGGAGLERVYDGSETAKDDAEQRCLHSEINNQKRKTQLGSFIKSSSAKYSRATHYGKSSKNGQKSESKFLIIYNF